jgi:hypothetical protein
MSRSLFNQHAQVRGTETFEDDLQIQYAEQCGRPYDTGTVAVVSGSSTMTDSATSFVGSEVDNFIVIATGAAAGTYKITSVSGLEATVSPVPTATDATATASRCYYLNTEDDLNYLRSMVKKIVGEDSWTAEPNTDLKNMAYLVPKRPNYIGETGQYASRPGTTTLTLSDIDQTGYVSSGAPAGEYTDNTASVTAGTSVRFTNDNTMVIAIAGGFYPADSGVINISKDGVVVGTLDLAAAWTADGCVYETVEGDVGSNPVHTATNVGTDIISLSNRRCMNTTVDGYSSFWPPYQIASMSATLTLASGFAGQVSVAHTGGGSTQNYTYSSFWVDTTASTITADAPVCSLASSTLKYLSGVPYYTTGSTFNVEVTNSETLFDRGYVTNPLTLSVSEFNAAAITPTLTQLGLTEPLAITDTIGTYSGIATVGAAAFRDMDARATATYRNVFATGTSANSAAGTFRIDTYGTVSTETVEYFDDEHKRYLGDEDFTDITLGDNHTADSNWNEETSLATTNGAEVYNSTLKYPTENHSTFLPAGPNYSALSGDMVFYRIFRSTGGSFTNGTITFSGWSNALSTIQGANVDVSLRYPNCTNYGNSNTNVWQDLSVDQTVLAGNGCLGAGSTGAVVAFSFGTTSSNAYGDRIIMKITLKNSSATALTSVTFAPTL